MGQLEKRMLETAEMKPESYNRYVDEIVSVFLDRKERAVQFVEHCNKQHPNIRFTFELATVGESVNFMT